MMMNPMMSLHRQALSRRRSRLRRSVIAALALTMLMIPGWSPGGSAHAQQLPAQYWPMPAGLAPQKSEAPPRPIPHRDNPRLMVFIYHNLVFGRTGNEYMRDLYNFESDLAYIQRNYRIIGLDELEAINASRFQIDTDAAIITFDDGDLSVYAIAYPILRDLGIRATFFIIEGSIGQTGYMSAEQIREMAAWRSADGRRLFDIGSHTVTHAYLGHISREALDLELRDSRRGLEAIIGRRVTALALPFGDGTGDPIVLAAAKAAGYTQIRGTRDASTPLAGLNPYDLPSYTVFNAPSDRVVSQAERLMGR